MNATRTDSTFGGGMNTVRGTSPTMRASAWYARAHGDRVVRAGAGRRRPALADLALHHHEAAGDVGNSREDAHEQRRRDVVRQVRDESRGSADERGEVDVHRVGDDDVDVARVRRAPRRSARATVASSSTATTRCAASASATVREPRPGPISRIVSSGCDVGEPDDPPHGVRIDEEVLSVTDAGAQVVTREQVAGDGRGHVLGHATILLRI